MYKGTPAKCFFSVLCKGEPRSNLFRVGLQNHFLAVNRKSRPTLHFQNAKLSEFSWVHVPTKNCALYILP